jgi:hypothetical protein
MNPEPQPVVPPLPETARRISGRTFKITDSPTPYFRTISLTFDGGNVYRSESTWPDGNAHTALGGLDDRFYVSEGIIDGRAIAIALKGYWQDEKTFVESVKDLVQLDNITQRYAFEGDKLTIDVQSSMGASFQMSGEMADPEAEPFDS